MVRVYLCHAIGSSLFIYVRQLSARSPSTFEEPFLFIVYLDMINSRNTSRNEFLPDLKFLLVLII